MSLNISSSSSTSRSTSPYRKIVLVGGKDDDDDDDGTRSDVLLQVPLAIGTLQWGTTIVDDRIINRKGVLTEQACRDILEAVRSAGVTLFDTAEGYGGGTSEKRLGRLLMSKDDDGNDKDSKKATSTSTTTTKDAPVPPPPPPPPIFMTKFLPAPWRLFHRDLESAVVGSCQRLRVRSIPIYLLHSPIHWYRNVDYWVEACAKCHRKGLIASMGLSNCNAQQVRDAVAAGRKYGIPVVCNQVHYSLLDYNSQELRLMERACRELNVKIIAFSPIGQGLLTETMTDENFRTNKATKMMRLQDSKNELDVLRREIQRLARKYDKSMVQICLNWCIRHDVIPLIGCRSSKQAQDTIGCLGWSLTDEDVQALDRVALHRSTLDSPPWRRYIFVSLFGIVMVVCRTLDRLGFGSVVPILTSSSTATSKDESE